MILKEKNMTPFDAFRFYLSIKSHFTTKSYNAIKYNYQVNVKYSTFEKRNDKLFFHKLSKHPDLIHFLVALFIRNPNLWVGDMVISEYNASIIYRDWLARQQSLKYTFIQDCNKLNLLTCLRTTKNNHPELFKLFLREEIAIETASIILDITGALFNLEKKLKGDIIFDQYSLILQKYIYFIKYDKKEYTKILKELTQNQSI